MKLRPRKIKRLVLDHMDNKGVCDNLKYMEYLLQRVIAHELAIYMKYLI